MNTTAARQSLTTVGQAVEVEVTDFSEAGFAAGLPKVWVAGVVFAVECADGTIADVGVRKADGGAQWFKVGPRGGNKTVRVAS